MAVFIEKSWKQISYARKVNNKKLKLWITKQISLNKNKK